MKLIAVLRGIKKVKYTKKDTGELKEGLELHCERPPYPNEPFVPGSDVVFTEYWAITEQNSKALAETILKWEIGSKIDLIYVQNGRFSNLVDVHLVEG